MGQTVRCCKCRDWRVWGREVQDIGVQLCARVLSFISCNPQNNLMRLFLSDNQKLGLCGYDLPTAADQ